MSQSKASPAATRTQTRSGKLELRDIEKVFGARGSETRAVDRLSLSIDPGEFVTLLGPSGCGKTTTLRMIAGFESPTSGEVLVDDVDMVNVAPNQRPMSMVFQSYALFPHLSVADNVGYGLKIKRLPAARRREEVAATLKSMGLAHLADRSPGQLSGGQQQRVALARAIVMKPKLLLFDEPLSNLDARLRDEMRIELRRLQLSLGITSVYVTHDQQEAMSMSDRIVVMNGGRIEQVDSPTGVYRRPSSEFVAGFVGSATFLDVSVGSVADGTAEIDYRGQRVRVAAHPDVRAGGKARLIVRPENMRLEARAGAHLVERGSVTAAAFYGATVEYRVDTAQGEFVMLSEDPDEGKILEVGASVSVHIPAERTWLLPASAS